MAFAVLWWGANLLSAVLALAAARVLHRRLHDLAEAHEPQNIVIGGAAGAVPVLVGWAAVTDSLGWAPIVLFVAMFLWTPPHFWALAIRYADEYRAADVPMLPAVVPLGRAARQMLGYTAAMVVATLVLSRSPTSGGSTASPRCSSAPGSSSPRSALARDPTPAGEHEGLHLQHHATSRCCSRAMTLDVLVAGA